MRVVQLPAAGGKTTALLEWMRQAPADEIRLLVATSAAEAQRVYESVLRAGERWAFPWQFVGIGEVLGLAKQRGRNAKQIVLGVDNLEMVLAQMLHYPVGFVTMTSDRQTGYGNVEQAVGAVDTARHAVRDLRTELAQRRDGLLTDAEMAAKLDVDQPPSDSAVDAAVEAVETLVATLADVAGAPSDSRDPRFCVCGSERGHAGWERCCPDG